MLPPASLQKLVGVHADLVKVVMLAAERIGFVVTEGLRTKAKQLQMVQAGHSQTMHSRHLTGHAVDLAPTLNGKVRWDWPAFYPLADTVKAAAAELQVPIEWGGDWQTFKDGPHFQLPWKEYP